MKRLSVVVRSRMRLARDIDVRTVRRQRCKIGRAAADRNHHWQAIGVFELGQVASRKRAVPVHVAAMSHVGD